MLFYDDFCEIVELLPLWWRRCSQS